MATPTFRTLLTSLAALVVAGTASAQSLTKLTIGGPNPWQPYTASLMYGKKLGFFKEEGLDPEFVAVQGTAILVPQVANKTITIGIPNPDLMLVALDKGERFPVKFFYNAYTKSPFEFVVPAGSPLASLSDLKGRKLGVGALTHGHLPILRAILKDAGVEWMKDVQVLPIGIGPAAWRRLQNGDVDAMSLWALQHESMALAGTPIKRLPIPAKYLQNFSNGFIAHDDTIAQNPRLVEGVARAVAKSYFACRVNTTACVKAYWDFDPASRPPVDKEADWLKTNVALNVVDLSIVFGGTRNEQRYGDYEPVAVQGLVATMADGGQLTKATLPTEQVFTRQFVEAANRWDRDAVRALAK
jgi:NitT/TauT family transport system substrate-binding protein